MGFILPGNVISFDIMNITCNYLPSAIYFFKNINKLQKVRLRAILRLQFTFLYALGLLILMVLKPTYILDVIPKEILPVFLFLLFAMMEVEVQWKLFVKVLRVTFIMCAIIYFLPSFQNTIVELIGNPIVFTKGVDNIVLISFGGFTRHYGFCFDFRILGQFGLLFFMIALFKKDLVKWYDYILIGSIVIMSFSRGPYIVFLFILFAVFLPYFIKYGRMMIITFSIFIFGLTLLMLTNESVLNYAKTFNVFSDENNAISQRSAFMDFAMDRFYENPLGSGIGSISSADFSHPIDFGYVDLINKERLFYYRASDAYWNISLAEKGIIVTILFAISFFEILLIRRNVISLFFIIGLMINMIGTDIPKEGFFYFIILLVLFQIKRERLDQELHQNK